MAPIVLQANPDLARDPGHYFPVRIARALRPRQAEGVIPYLVILYERL